MRVHKSVGEVNWAFPYTTRTKVGVVRIFSRHGSNHLRILLPTQEFYILGFPVCSLILTMKWQDENDKLHVGSKARYREFQYTLYNINRFNSDILATCFYLNH